MYQQLAEEEALALALSESLHLYQVNQEEEELAMAIQMSLSAGGEEVSQQSADDSGIPHQLRYIEQIPILIRERSLGIQIRQWRLWTMVIAWDFQHGKLRRRHLFRNLKLKMDRILELSFH